MALLLQPTRLLPTQLIQQLAAATRLRSLADHSKRVITGNLTVMGVVKPRPTFWNRCVLDRHGRLVLFEKPNTPLILWAVCSFLDFVVGHSLWVNSPLHTLFRMLAFGFIFIWAWLELSQGTTYLRRLLGFIVLVFILVHNL
jgi:hypothetical protein